MQTYNLDKPIEVVHTSNGYISIADMGRGVEQKPSPQWQLDGRDARPARYFSLDLSLEGIPDPAPCGVCGAPMQREFLDYETSTPSLTVIALSTPGYGCTGCGLKAWEPTVLVRLLKGAAEQFRAAGEIQNAERLEFEASWHEEVSNPVATVSLQIEINEKFAK